MQKLIKISISPEITQEIGAEIAKLLMIGDVISVSGELGTGKTCLIGGIVRALGGGDNITSASFTMLSVYDASVPIYHFDAYRLDDSAQAVNLGIDDYIFGKGITIIEWGDRIKNILPDGSLIIEIEYIEDETRKITIFSNSEKWQERILKLRKIWIL